jgi:hypothetical protein
MTPGLDSLPPGSMLRAVRRLHAIVMLSLASLAAGCGSTYAKADFIARADAICASALRQTRSISPISTGQQRQALSAYLAKVLPIVQSEANQIRALRPPPGNARDRAKLEAYRSALAQITVDYRELAAAAKRGDVQGMTSAEAALRSSSIASLAASYGLRSCGTPGATVA